MIRTHYIRVKTTKRNEDETYDGAQQDKIARIYALAKELHVKIGGEYERVQDTSKKQ